MGNPDPGLPKSPKKEAGGSLSGAIGLSGNSSGGKAVLGGKKD